MQWLGGKPIDLVEGGGGGGGERQTEETDGADSAAEVKWIEHEKGEECEKKFWSQVEVDGRRRGASHRVAS